MIIVSITSLVMIAIIIWAIHDKVVYDECYSVIPFMVLFGLFYIILIICPLVFTHIYTAEKIKQVEVEQEMLVEVLKTYKEAEEIGSIEVVKYVEVKEMIAEWNKEVIMKKKLANNLFINWFYNKKVVDTMRLIE